MHYKNGREAKVGDSVIGSNNGIPVVGTVIFIQPSAQQCNLMIHSTQKVKSGGGQSDYPIVGAIVSVAGDATAFMSTTFTSYTASEFFHAEDALACIAAEWQKSVDAQKEIPA